MSLLTMYGLGDRAITIMVEESNNAATKLRVETRTYRREGTLFSMEWEYKTISNNTVTSAILKHLSISDDDELLRNSGRRYAEEYRHSLYTALCELCLV